MALLRWNPLKMDYHSQVPGTFTLAGDYEQRLVQVLEIARHLARIAQVPADRHMQDTLAALEDALSDHLAAIETAADDDKTDSEDTGDAERKRRAYYPLRVA
jgi:hypothetical protein